MLRLALTAHLMIGQDQSRNIDRRIHCLVRSEAKTTGIAAHVEKPTNRRLAVQALIEVLSDGQRYPVAFTTLTGHHGIASHKWDSRWPNRSLSLFALELPRAPPSTLS